MSYKLHNCKKRYVAMAVLHFSVEIIKEIIVVQYKIRHVYSTIHQLWSNFHQLVKIFVIVYRLFFQAQFLCIQSSNRPGKFSQRIIFLRLNTVAAIDIHTNNNAFFKGSCFWLPRCVLKFFLLNQRFFKCKLAFLTWNVFNKSSSLFIVR